MSPFGNMFQSSFEAFEGAEFTPRKRRNSRPKLSKEEQREMEEKVYQTTRLDDIFRDRDIRRTSTVTMGDVSTAKHSVASHEPQKSKLEQKIAQRGRSQRSSVVTSTTAFSAPSALGGRDRSVSSTSRSRSNSASSSTRQLSSSRNSMGNIRREASRSRISVRKRSVSPLPQRAAAPTKAPPKRTRSSVQPSSSGSDSAASALRRAKSTSEAKKNASLKNLYGSLSVLDLSDTTRHEMGEDHGEEDDTAKLHLSASSLPSVAYQLSDEEQDEEAPRTRSSKSKTKSKPPKRSLSRSSKRRNNHRDSSIGRSAPQRSSSSISRSERIPPKRSLSRSSKRRSSKREDNSLERGPPKRTSSSLSQSERVPPKRTSSRSGRLPPKRTSSSLSRSERVKHKRSSSSQSRSGKSQRRTSGTNGRRRSSLNKDAPQPTKALPKRTKSTVQQPSSNGGIALVVKKSLPRRAKSVGVSNNTDHCIDVSTTVCIDHSRTSQMNSSITDSLLDWSDSENNSLGDDGSNKDEKWSYPLPLHGAEEEDANKERTLRSSNKRTSSREPPKNANALPRRSRSSLQSTKLSVLPKKDTLRRAKSSVDSKPASIDHCRTASHNYNQFSSSLSMLNWNYKSEEENTEDDGDIVSIFSQSTSCIPSCADEETSALVGRKKIGKKKKPMPKRTKSTPSSSKKNKLENSSQAKRSSTRRGSATKNDEAPRKTKAPPMRTRSTVQPDSTSSALVKKNALPRRAKSTIGSCSNGNYNKFSSSLGALDWSYKREQDNNDDDILSICSRSASSLPSHAEEPGPLEEDTTSKEQTDVSATKPDLKRTSSSGKKKSSSSSQTRRSSARRGSAKEAQQASKVPPKRTKSTVQPTTPPLLEKGPIRRSKSTMGSSRSMARFSSSLTLLDWSHKSEEDIEDDILSICSRSDSCLPSYVEESSSLLVDTTKKQKRGGKDKERTGKQKSTSKTFPKKARSSLHPSSTRASAKEAPLRRAKSTVGTQGSSSFYASFSVLDLGGDQSGEEKEEDIMSICSHSTSCLPIDASLRRSSLLDADRNNTGGRMVDSEEEQALPREVICDSHRHQKDHPTNCSKKIPSPKDTAEVEQYIQDCCKKAKHKSKKCLEKKRDSLGDVLNSKRSSTSSATQAAGSTASSKGSDCSLNTLQRMKDLSVLRQEFHKEAVTLKSNGSLASLSGANKRLPRSKSEDPEIDLLRRGNVRSGSSRKSKSSDRWILSKASNSRCSLHSSSEASEEKLKGNEDKAMGTSLRLENLQAKWKVDIAAVSLQGEHTVVPF